MRRNRREQAGATVKIYLVGGAVRDELLDLPVVERDWVVVGATPAQMIEQGFTPADDIFPVFLHPRSGDEYALARRETKQGDGYRGFDVDAGLDVTLEQDLLRRDLTVNAMARAEDGTLIDPYLGRDDLDAGLLRHVSPAFVEDPLRVLRIARFAAKLGAYGFRVAHGTHRLMCDMVADGAMRHINAERAWRELSRAMATTHPWRFVEVLHRCGALHYLIPPMVSCMGDSAAHDNVIDSRAVAALKMMSARHQDVAPRVAAMLAPCVDSPQAAEALGQTLRADRATLQLLMRFSAGARLAEQARDGDVDAVVELLRVWRGFQRDSDVAILADIADAVAGEARLSGLVRVALDAAQAVDSAKLRAQGYSGGELGEQLAVARRAAIGEAWRRVDPSS